MTIAFMLEFKLKLLTSCLR